ncbi:MAG: hypothetical protein HW416_3460 [Chloroflexi bacterium]|nr:hypothetical protein [Chloroflexota bacterium]
MKRALKHVGRGFKVKGTATIDHLYLKPRSPGASGGLRCNGVDHFDAITSRHLPMICARSSGLATLVFGNWSFQW